jgi:PAS domain S-box-containing protein
MQASSGAMETTPATAKPQAKILIVDDTAANLRLLHRILTGQGYVTHPANSGETALQFMQTVVPDIVLLDVMMPEMDGYELCRRMKANERLRDVPVIFVSAQDAAWDKVKAFSVGAVDYVVKPIDETELLARLDTHLSLHHLRRHLERRIEERTAALLRAKEALHENQLLLKAIIDSSKALIHVKDLDGCYLLVNQRFQELFGQAGQDMRGLTDTEIFPVEIAAAMQALDRKVTDTGNAIEAEELLPHGDEMHTYISVKSPLRHTSGQVYAVCCIATDITERVRDEVALRELNDMLESRLMERLPMYISGLQNPAPSGE